MDRPPRPPAEPLFSARMLAVSLGLGLSMLVAVGLAYAWAAASGRSEGEVRALGFAAVVFGNLALILATRSRERTIVATFSRPNPALWWILAGTLAALAGALYVPAAADLFRFGRLGALELAVALGAGVLGVLWLEAVKLARRRKSAA